MVQLRGAAVAAVEVLSSHHSPHPNPRVSSAGTRFRRYHHVAAAGAAAAVRYEHAQKQYIRISVRVGFMPKLSQSTGDGEYKVAARVGCGRSNQIANETWTT